MIKWKHGPHRPLKKLPRWIWAILSAVYIMSVYLMIMHTAQKTLSGNAPGDMPVIVIVLVAVVVGMGWRYATSKSV